MQKKQLVGYCDPLSVVPGDRVEFKVSSYGPKRYRADLVRLVCGDDTPGGPGVIEEELASAINGEHEARHQPIPIGSHVVVPGLAGRLDGLSGLSLVAAVRASAPEATSAAGAQCLLATSAPGSQEGFALYLDARGALTFRLGGPFGEATFTLGEPLPAQRWMRVAACFDGERGRVRLLQAPVGTYRGGDPPPPRIERTFETELDRLRSSDGPLLMAAWPVAGAAAGETVTAAHYNGQLVAPRVVGRALADDELAALLAASEPAEEAAAGADLLGFWDFSRDITGERVTDLSSHGHEGETVQLPTRGVTGYRWDGSEPSFRHAPEHYGAIHFHDDDLYDASWQTDFVLDVPDDLPSGIYAARLRPSDGPGGPESEGLEDHVPFFVRPPRGRATAPVAFLAATATYMAYANSRLHFQAPGVEMMRGRLTLITPGKYFMMEHPEVGLSLYDHHADGSGVCYTSRLRPILDLKPRERLWSFNADTLIPAWLEHEGIAYDVVTDEDLDAEGAELLAPYRVVLTGAHPEYYSSAMLDGLLGYLDGGGRLMYLGGNGLYWKVTFHSTKPGVLEVRRAEDGTRAWRTAPGEAYHSFTGEYGGLWQRLGRPPNLIVGVGFTAQGFDVSSYYRRRPESFDPRAAFLFDGVEADELVGDFGINGGGAAGEEIDRYDRRHGSPAHALVVATSEAHSSSYMITKEELFSNVPGTSGEESPMVRADLVFFETPAGGAVFSTGSIAWTASLCHDDYRNNVARITGNALRRFLDEAPFEMPE